MWGKYPLAKVEIIGDYSVRFCLTRPYPLFLWHLSQIKDGMIVSPGALKGASGSDVVVAAPVGTGPYRLKEHVGGQSWTMGANEGYWQGDVGIKRNTIALLNASPQRGLQAGQNAGNGISTGGRGCSYVACCSQGVPVCGQERPVWREIYPGHLVRCHVVA